MMILKGRVICSDLDTALNPNLAGNCYVEKNRGGLGTRGSWEILALFTWLGSVEIYREGEKCPDLVYFLEAGLTGNANGWLWGMRERGIQEDM